MVITAILLFSFEIQAAAVFETDQINDTDRVYFNGFELSPSSFVGAVYTEDNIRVEQINDDLDRLGYVDITTTYLKTGFEGSRAWYPNGGDSGYTSITLYDGAEFGTVGFMRASGGRAHPTLLYELWNNGELVQSGFVEHAYSPATYLGFGGGGFDEIRVRDGEAPTSADDGSHNALAIDSIEVSDVTLASTAAVPATGIFGITILTLLLVFLGVIYIKRGELLT